MTARHARLPGVPRPRAAQTRLLSTIVAEASPKAPTPAEFAAAVASLTGASLRPEVVIERVKPPQRLAPWSFALAVDVAGAPSASGRLVLLHDPAGHESWHGTLRLVGFAGAEMDPEIGWDPLLAQVGWSWLTDALRDHGARYTAAGGTITQTASTRFGELAGPQATVEIELRASWTPLDTDLARHLRAWADLLCTAAGLPPEGVSAFPARRDRGDA